jgi:iron complex transport system permease protein
VTHAVEPVTTVRAGTANGTAHERTALGLLGLLCGASVVAAIGLGPVVVSPGEVIEIIGHHLFDRPAVANWSASNDAIIWQVRLPRVLMGTVVGAALAATGTALQAIVGNPLAEPHLIGVSAGASTGAAAAILFGAGAALGGRSTTTVAFIGALGAIALVLVLARTGGAITSGKLLIAGVATGYLLSAITSMLILFADSAEGARAVMFWLLGSLARAEWSALPTMTIGVAIGLCWLLWWRRRIDLLAAGDELARAVGVHPGRTRFGLLVIISLCVGSVVAVSGGIGFIGLAVPHIARAAVGASHRVLLPASMLIGATALVWADVVARLAIQPRELPIGVVTGLIGAPFLFFLVRNMQLHGT